MFSMSVGFSAISLTKKLIKSTDVIVGYLVAQVKAILQSVTDPLRPPLLYVEFFNFSNTHFTVVNGVRVVVPAPKIKMFLVHHRLRSNGLPLGDIVPINSVRQVVQLIPKFGTVVPQEMTHDNCLNITREFYINSFISKPVISPQCHSEYSAAPYRTVATVNVRHKQMLSFGKIIEF
jgi:hypothetical protein